MISNFPYSNTWETPILLFHQLKGTNSRITCFRRASLRSLPVFKEVYGLNSILSCGTEIEKMAVENLAEQNGISYYNIDISNHKIFHNFLAEDVKRIHKILIDNSHTMLVHCAYGVRRTGIVIYSLLRFNGESKECAIEIITKLRQESKNGIGDLRIEYAEKYIVPLLLK